jgi:hypothetical protein
VEHRFSEKRGRMSRFFDNFREKDWTADTLAHGTFRNWMLGVERFGCGASRAVEAATTVSLLSFYQRCCFAIERGVIRLARLQIKFVDHDLHQRRGRNSEKNSQQPKHGGCREGKE